MEIDLELFNLLPAPSRIKLEGTTPELVNVVALAYKGSRVTFRVVEGIRSAKRQAELVKSGASRIKRSKHQDGLAVDLAPYIGNQIRWDWPLFFPIAEAMALAGEALGVSIIWGGCWHKITGQHIEGVGRKSMEDMQTDYIISCSLPPKRKPFLDGPHFELA